MSDLAKIDLSKASPEQKAEILRLLDAKHTLDMSKDLYKYFLEAWKVLEPITPLEPSWHYQYLAEWLTLVQTGEFKERYPDAIGLVVNVPPQTAKSSFITITYPTWCWATNPAQRFICASYSLGLSESHSVKRRALMNDEWFKKRWGHKFKLREDQDTKREYYNDKTGQMIAASVGGSITGKHGSILILDDPLNPEQAASDADRKTANRWFDDTFESRRLKPNGLIVVVMQRLHEDDVTGHVLEENKKAGTIRWVHVKIPLVCEQDTDIVFPISGTVIKVKQGAILQPSRNSATYVEYLKKKPRLFAGQFQQRPAPAEGNIIKRSWIRYYGDPNDSESPILPPEFKRKLQSWDLTFKGKSKNDSDYVCGLVVGVKDANRFLLDRLYRQMSFTQTVSAILAMREKHPDAKEILIEDKANGPAVIDSLQSKITGVIPVNPQGDKQERLEIASYAVESGNWYFPHPSICPWIEEFIENLVTFPNAKHDDDADAFSQAENRIGKRGGAGAFLEAFDRMLKKAGHADEAEKPEQTAEPEVGQQTVIPQKHRKLLAGVNRPATL